MPEPIVRTPSEQSQNPAPEQEQQASEPQTAVPEQAAAAAEQAAEQEAKAREEAEQTRKAAVRAYRNGEKSYRAGLLESGRLCDVYCLQRVALGDKRAAAVQALEGELAKWSSTAVDVDRLIRCHHAFRLLAEEPGLKAEAMPYGHYRDAWCQLVERRERDKPAEHWVLLPGMEQEARDLFAKAAADSLSKAAVQEGVKVLLRLYADRQAEQAAVAKAAAEQEAKAKAAEQQQAAKEAKAAEQAAQEARAAEQAAKEEDRARLTEATLKAEEELRAKQQAAIVAQAAAEQAARDKARKEREAKAAEDAKRKAAEKAQKAAERGQQKPKNLLSTDKGDTSSIAALAAEYITECDTPDDVFALLLRRLRDSGELSKQSLRAIDAALLVLSRSERKPEPSANSKPETAAA